MIPGDLRPRLTASVGVDSLNPRGDNTGHRAAVAVPRPKVFDSTSSQPDDTLLTTGDVEPPGSNWTTCSQMSPVNSEMPVHSTMEPLRKVCDPNEMRQSLTTTVSEEPIEPLPPRPFTVGGVP